MTNPGIDIAAEAKRIRSYFAGNVGNLENDIVALCLRVEEAATKAERESCIAIADVQECDGCDSGCGQNIKRKILARNGETK